MAHPAKEARDRVIASFPDAVVVERRRNSIKHAIPSIPNKFILDLGSGESIAFQPQQLQYTNDLDQIQAIANPQSVGAVVQDEDVLFWQGAFGPGFDIRWPEPTARLDKHSVVG